MRAAVRGDRTQKPLRKGLVGLPAGCPAAQSQGGPAELRLGLCYTLPSQRLRQAVFSTRGQQEPTRIERSHLSQAPAEHWSHVIIKLDLIVGFLNNSLPPPNAAKPHGPTAP